MWQCESCSETNPDSAKVCQSCGLGVAGTKYSRHYTSESIKIPDTIPIEEYIPENPTASLFSVIGNVLLVFTVILSFAVFIFLGQWFGPELGFLMRLVIALGTLGIYVIPALLLKAIAHIWQNTQDTSNLLLYFMEKDQMETKSEAE